MKEKINAKHVHEWKNGSYCTSCATINYYGFYRIVSVCQSHCHWYLWILEKKNEAIVMHDHDKRVWKMTKRLNSFEISNWQSLNQCHELHEPLLALTKHVNEEEQHGGNSHFDLLWKTITKGSYKMTTRKNDNGNKEVTSYASMLKLHNNN